MRLLRYILIELAIVACALVGAGVASERLASAVIDGWEERVERLRAEAAALPPHGEISEPPEPTITDEPTGTFLGMSDELLLDRVRRQPIVRVKLNKGGSSLSFRVDFADGSRAAFKPAQTNLQTVPRKEVAAYRLNRLLGLGAVPPATGRSVSREDLLSKLHPESVAALPRIRAETIFNPMGKTAGVFSYWIPEIIDSGLDSGEGLRACVVWLTHGTDIPPDKRPLAAQVSDLILFDFLTANPDRYSGGNIKMSPDGSQLYFMDNTMSFFLNPDGHPRNRQQLDRTQRFTRHVYRALARVTVPALERLMSGGDDSEGVLTPSEIRAVVARREVAQRHIEALAGFYGES
ncbi:MAG TPA: hypothetical protein VN914_10445, partial [Polyangia bacterium]|nr:hypothetical protein [Polyangia bacterium]